MRSAAAPRLEYAARNRPAMQSQRTENRAKGKYLALENSRRAKLSPDSCRTRAFSIHLLTSLASGNFLRKLPLGPSIQGQNRKHCNGMKRMGPPRRTAADSRHEPLLFPTPNGDKSDGPGVQNEKLILRKTLSVSSIKSNSSMLFVTMGAQEGGECPGAAAKCCALRFDTTRRCGGALRGNRLKARSRAVRRRGECRPGNGGYRRSAAPRRLVCHDSR